MQQRQRPAAQRLVHAGGDRRGDVVLGQQHPQRAAAGLLLPGGHRRLELGLADARDLAQARARVAVDDLEHLVAVALAAATRRPWAPRA